MKHEENWIILKEIERFEGKKVLYRFSDDFCCQQQQMSIKEFNAFILWFAIQQIVENKGLRDSGHIPAILKPIYSKCFRYSITFNLKIRSKSRYKNSSAACILHLLTFIMLIIILLVFGKSIYRQVKDLKYSSRSIVKLLDSFNLWY